MPHHLKLTSFHIRILLYSVMSTSIIFTFLLFISNRWHLKKCHFWFTFGVVTLGLLPPIAPGSIEPVSLYLASIFDTHPWLTLKYFYMYNLVDILNSIFNISNHEKRWEQNLLWLLMPKIMCWPPGLEKTWVFPNSNWVILWASCKEDVNRWFLFS